MNVFGYSRELFYSQIYALDLENVKLSTINFMNGCLEDCYFDYFNGLFLMNNQHQILGCLSYKILSGDFFDETRDCLFINNFAVKSEMFGHGRLLLNKLKLLASIYQVDIILKSVPSALGFYKHLGFEIFATRTCLYSYQKEFYYAGEFKDGYFINIQNPLTLTLD